jgi:hypothetical protein
MLARIIRDENLESGIEPSIGKFHEWSPEFYQGKGLEILPLYLSGKIFSALVRGQTAIYLRTDREDSLREWILSQPKRSVTLHGLFRVSYRLNEGDVYLTILTIENVLSVHWRASDREKIDVTQRLSSIINFFGTRADHFGSWYHLFGIMLFGYVSTDIQATWVGTIETLGSHLLSSGEDETQEHFMNQEGGLIGAKLRRMLEQRSWKKVPFYAEEIQSDDYLNLDEKFEGRLLQL